MDPLIDAVTDALEACDARSTAWTDDATRVARNLEMAGKARGMERLSALAADIRGALERRTADRAARVAQALRGVLSVLGVGG